MSGRNSIPPLGATLVLALLVFPGAGTGTSAVTSDDAPFHFVDVSGTTGVDVVTWCGRPHKPHILESGGYGVALFDYDGDRDLDLYVVNGWRLEGSEVVERGRNRLYRNRGDGTFEDVTAAAGVGDDGWGAGAEVDDVDGDGDPDLFVTNFGPDVLYLNQGDGTFRVDPEGPGIDGWSASAAFFDADDDGDPDLFVTAYIDSTIEEVLSADPSLHWEGTKVMRGPFGLEGLANRYFENLGDGRFREATEEAGFTDVGLFYSFALASLDLDGDLDLDVYVANDSNPNYLYRNDGDGRFEEIGLWSGAALSGAGYGQAGMGVAAGDVDGDGDPELFVTNFGKDASTLYRNLGKMVFEDVSARVGVRGPTYDPLSWGTALADFDLDGDLDLFVANGHIYPQADEVEGSPVGYAQRNLLLANDDGSFTDVTADSGPGLRVVESSRGAAAGDLDGDGDLDLVVSNVDAPPTILRNDTERRGAWLIVDAPEARVVEAVLGDRRVVRHRVGGGSYASANDPRFHLGLGSVDAVDRLVVTWPDGHRSEFRDVKPNRVVTITPEGGLVERPAPARDSEP